MLNKNELKASIARHGDRQEDLAAALGLTASGLSVKVTGAVEFKRNEIELIILRYKLSPEELQRIFFADDVTQNDTMTNQK